MDATDQLASQGRSARRSPPLSTQLQNSLGLALFGLGGAERFAGIELILAEYQFEGYDMVLVVAGLILMIPIWTFSLRQARERKD